MQDKQSKCHMTRNMAATNINYQAVVRSIQLNLYTHNYLGMTLSVK